MSLPSYQDPAGLDFKTAAKAAHFEGHSWLKNFCCRSRGRKETGRAEKYTREMS
jgi:hypothetical protein